MRVVHLAVVLCLAGCLGAGTPSGPVEAPPTGPPRLGLIVDMGGAVYRLARHA